MVKVFSRDRGPSVTVPVEKTTAKSTTSSNTKILIVEKKKHFCIIQIIILGSFSLQEGVM